MKKSLKTALAVAVMGVSAIMGYVFYTQYHNKQLAFANPLMEENVEALADPAGVNTLWHRDDQDCVYTVTGKAGGTIKVKIVGIGIVNLTLGADGSASYTYPGGKTICTAGGNQQCESRYCPQLSFM